MLLQRAVKVSLAWLGPRDRRRLAALREAYRAAVRFFVRLLWREPDAKLSTATSERLRSTRLSTRYRDQALKQAVDVVTSTRKSAKALGVEAGRPEPRGAAILDAKFVRIERGDTEHDLVVHLACLKKGKPLRIRTRGTRVLKKWLSRPGARLVQGCALGGATSSDRLTLWVEFPAPAKKEEGPVVGVDVGVSKLLATSDGEFLGTDFRRVRDKVRRRRPGSKGRRRARRERDDLILHATKRLPWAHARAIAFEELAGIKRGKKPGRGRAFRRALAPWRASFVEARLATLAAESGVHAIGVPARGNSTTCPSCRFRSRENRRGDVFACVECGLVDDADHVGALAVKRLGEERLAESVAVWRQQCEDDQARRERRKAAAKRRGDATAEKWRRKRAASASAKGESTDDERQDTSSTGAQSPAARIPSGSAPIRDSSVGRAPENVGGQPPAEENDEGGLQAGRRSTATERRRGATGMEPVTTSGNTAKLDAVGSWPLDAFPNKP